MMGCRGLQGKQEIRVPAPSVTASRPRTLGTFSSFWSTTPAPAVPDAPAANDALARDTEEMRVPLPAPPTPQTTILIYMAARRFCDERHIHMTLWA